MAATPPPATPRRDAVATTSRKGDESRLRILEAALREFGTHGFKATTTRQIAQSANTTLPPLQYYFGNKEGLYRACAEEIIRRFRGTTLSAVARADQAGADSNVAPEVARQALKDILESMVHLTLVNGGIKVGHWAA